MEFKQITDLTKALPKEVKFNYPELKAELETKLEKYKDVEVTEENLKDSKSDKALLNNLAKAFDAERIRLKKEYMKPFDLMETKVKELTGMIKEVSDAINVQVKAFDEAEKETKRKEIEQFFCDNVGDLRELLAFNKIFNETWLNKGSLIAEIKTEITKTITKVTADLAVIDGLDGDFSTQCKDCYLRTLDLSGALAEVKRLEENKKRLEEYEAKKKEEREAADLERRQNEQLAKFTTPITETYLWKAPDEPAFEQPQEAQEQQYNLTLWATDEQYEELTSFLFISGIRFEKR